MWKRRNVKIQIIQKVLNKIQGYTSNEIKQTIFLEEIYFPNSMTQKVQVFFFLLFLPPIQAQPPLLQTYQSPSFAVVALPIPLRSTHLTHSDSLQGFSKFTTQTHHGNQPDRFNCPKHFSILWLFRTFSSLNLDSDNSFYF